MDNIKYLYISTVRVTLYNNYAHNSILCVKILFSATSVWLLGTAVLLACLPLDNGGVLLSCSTNVCGVPLHVVPVLLMHLLRMWLGQLRQLLGLEVRLPGFHLIVGETKAMLLLILVSVIVIVVVVLFGLLLLFSFGLNFADLVFLLDLV